MFVNLGKCSTLGNIIPKITIARNVFRTFHVPSKQHYMSPFLKNYINVKNIDKRYHTIARIKKSNLMYNSAISPGNDILKLSYGSGKGIPKVANEKELAPTTYKEKLKQAMAQYGSTVIIFHISISLVSLGVCYTLVASGLDISSMLEKCGLSEKAINKLASSSGTFAAAYLIHKVLAPIRISITLTCTPFIVRYLRKVGIIKKAIPKKKDETPKSPIQKKDE